jgi:hypothetical protein
MLRFHVAVASASVLGIAARTSACGENIADNAASLPDLVTEGVANP